MDNLEESQQSVSELEQNAFARKERLKNVRAQLSAKRQDKNDMIDSEEPLFFRSYKPIDLNAPLAKADEQLTVVENVIKKQIESTFDTTVQETLDLDTLAPRKVDWDLRRGIQQKLDLLDRKTQKSIAQLIRMRLELGDADLLVSAVNSAPAADMTEDIEE